MTTTLDATPSRDATRSRGLHVTLWIVQGLAALGFAMAGIMKSTTPIDQLAAKMAWVTHFPPLAVRLIGTAEILGALGLIVPAALRIQPKLTAVAGACLAALMVGAAGTHVVIGEPGRVLPSVVLGGLAAFVAWGRGTRAPIAAR